MAPGDGGSVLAAGFTLNGYTSPGTYQLTSPNEAVIAVAGASQVATSGSVTVKPDGRSGTWNATFPSQDVISGWFAC